MEIPVRIQGSQVSLRDGTEHSDFFEEDTSTLILFPQGAVVRLGAAVKPGQKLAVTNLKTSQDVLCRVVNVKRYPNVKGYVEIEFTRAAEGFWGVRLPSEVPTAAGRAAGSAASSEAKAQPAKLMLPGVAAAGSEKPVAASPSFDPVTEPSVPAPVPSSTPVVPAAAAETKVKEQPVGSAPPIQAIAGAREEGPAAAASSPEVWELNVPAAVPSSAPVAPAVSAAAAGPGAKEQGVDSAHTVDTVDGASEGKAAAAPPPPSADAWELSVPACGGSVMVPWLPGAPETEPEEQEVAASSGEATLASENVAATARPRSSGDWGSPLGRLEREAALLSDHSAPPEVFGRLAHRSAAVESVRYRRPPSKLLLASVFVVVAGLAVAAGTMLFRHHPESAVGPASSSAVAAPAPSPNSEPQLKTEPEAVAPAAQAPPVVGPDIELSTRERARNSTEARAQEGIKEPADIRRPPAASKRNSPAPAPHAAVGETAHTVAPETAVAEPAVPAAPPEVVQSKPAANASEAEKQAALSEAPQVPAVTGDASVVAPGASAGSAAPERPASSVSGTNAEASRASPVPAPSPAPEAETPVRVSRQVREPRLAYSVQPIYPTVAKENHVQGDVVIETDIDASGKVVSMTIVSGPLMLRQPALDALHRWRYEPARLDGQPVPRKLMVTMKFRLK